MITVILDDPNENIKLLEGADEYGSLEKQREYFLEIIKQEISL